MADALSTILETTQTERLATGFGFTEGPLWDPTNECYYFVDLRRNRPRGAAEHCLPHPRSGEHADPAASEACGRPTSHGSRPVAPSNVRRGGIRAVLSSPVLWGVSSPSSSSAALPQPVLSCAPQGAATRREARLHTPGEAWLLAGGAEGAGECTPADAGAKMLFVFPIRVSDIPWRYPLSPIIKGVCSGYV